MYEILGEIHLYLDLYPKRENVVIDLHAFMDKSRTIDLAIDVLIALLSDKLVLSDTLMIISTIY